MNKQAKESMIPTPTIFDGALKRTLDGTWQWRDGTAEPRVRDMRLADMAPSFRCVTHGQRTYVEIPHDWHECKYWPSRVVDGDARKAIQRMLSDGSGEAGSVYAEGIAEMIDDHRAAKHGYTVPIEVWDEAMAFVCGAWFDEDDRDGLMKMAQAIR